MIWRSKKSNNKNPVMSDAELARILQKWQGLTPPSDFQSSVWRRIASTSGSELPPPFAFSLLFKKLGLQPARGVLAAAAAGMIIGAGAVFFLFSSPAAVTEPDLRNQLSPSRSLTRAYTEMVTGGGNEI